MDVTRRHGLFLAVGLIPTYHFQFRDLSLGDKRIKGIQGGDTNDLKALVKLVAQMGVTSDVKTFTMEEADAMLDAVRDGSTWKGRAVMLPSA